MDFAVFIDRIVQQYKDNLPFIIYSLPDSNTAIGYLQKSGQVFTDNAFDKNGFVMYPFRKNSKGLIIPSSESEILETKFDFTEIEKTKVEIIEKESDHKNHLQLVQRGINAINDSESEKIVLSRKTDIQLKDFSLAKLIRRLFSIYPTAFRYVWFHPETGIWCGATPETLVSIKDNHFKTMALAGTQSITDGPIYWRQKEREEQHFVTTAIVGNIKPLVKELTVSDVRNQRAGMLVHLCTDISGKIKEDMGSAYNIAMALHPTPAVCGTPQKLAEEFIVHNEGYSREYYTGFLGIVSEEASSLMVNLRCMKIEHNVASLFIGGGITADSVPEEEWFETQNKMQTMLQVLQPML